MACGTTLWPHANRSRCTAEPLMIYTKLAEIEGLVTAAGLDVGALSLIVSEAFDEDLGGRGVLPPGAGARLDVTSYATIPAGDSAHGTFVARAAGHRRRLARSCLYRGRRPARRLATSNSLCTPLTATASHAAMF